MPIHTCVGVLVSRRACGGQRIARGFVSQIASTFCLRQDPPRAWNLTELVGLVGQ